MTDPNATPATDLPSQRGPNTHYFMPHYANTTVHVLRTVDVDGVEHFWEVPAEVVAEARASVPAAEGLLGAMSDPEP